MKEYTYGQVVDLLEKNPSLKFKFIKNEISKFEIDNGVIITSNGKNVICMCREEIYEYKLGDRFILVQEPVTFDEVLKYPDKKVKVKHEYVKITCDEFYDRFNWLSDVIFSLGRDLNSEGISKVLSDGEWYIEE